MSMKALKLLLALTALIGGTALGHADEELPAQVKIASQYIRESGCHESIQTFTTTVLHPERLDRSYHGGPLDGIEVRVTTSIGGSYSNFRWQDDHTISYTLTAKGGGTWIAPPKFLGMSVGGGMCANAYGGSIGIEIFAHYK